MRLFVVLSHLGGGGAERVGVLLSNGLAERGHEVYIVTNLQEKVVYSVKAQVKMLNMVSSNSNKLVKWGSAFINLRRFITLYHPEIVIGVMQTCGLLSKIACLGTKTHVIMTEHDSFERPTSAPMSKVDYLCKYYLNQIYECVTVISQADKVFIGNRLKHVVVMPNPLLLKPIKDIPPKESILLAAGRIDGWHVKGFDVLIRAWAKIVNSELKVNRDGWQLQIAGTGSEKSLNYLKQLCKENGVEDSVEFLGFQNNMEKLYQKASVFVLSSRYEGFGLVLIEAMSQGCACVACDYKGRQREIIQDDRQGLCCEPDNVNSLAAGIQKMIEDSEYRESVRPNAIERSEYYSIENTIDRWISLLFSLQSRNS